MQDDTDEIHRRLNDELESLISKYWSGWITDRRKGIEIALLTPRIKQGKSGTRKPTSSFTVDLSGSDRGRWFRFSQGVGGRPLSLIHYGEHGTMPSSKADYAEAFRIAREFLGMERGRAEDTEAAQERAKRRKQEEAERAKRAAVAAAEKARRDEERIESAAEVWKGTIPIAGTLGEAYLVARGLPPISEWPWNPDLILRFHPSLVSEIEARAGAFPAIVAKASDQYGETRSVWQIFLDRKEPKKAELDNAKVGRGPSKGCAVRLGGSGPWIGIAEGLETALAAWVLEGYRRPVWAGLSTSGVSGFQPPMEIERITVYPDGDQGVIGHNGRIDDPPGIKAARSLVERMQPLGIRTQISEMATLGDALDLLQVRNRHDKKTKSANAP